MSRRVVSIDTFILLQCVPIGILQLVYAQHVPKTDTMESLSYASQQNFEENICLETSFRKLVYGFQGLRSERCQQ